MTSISFEMTRSDEIRQARDSRRGHKGHLTRKLNELENFVEQNDSTSEMRHVKKKIGELREAQRKLEESNNVYCSLLDKEEDKAEAIEYFNVECRRVIDIEHRVKEWLKGHEHEYDLNPSDSVSAVDDKETISRSSKSKLSRHCSAKSKLSKTSSVSTSVSKFSKGSSCSSSTAANAKLKIAAKRAALIAEAELLEQRQSLAKEKLRVEQEELRLKLKTEIAKAEAEEKIYEEFMSSESERNSYTPIHVGTAVNSNKMFMQTESGPNERSRLVNDSNSKYCDETNQNEKIEGLETIQRVQQQVEKQLRSQLLPRAELMHFDGSPLNYTLFIKSFENNVEKYTENNSERLQLLIQYCTGKAKEVIKSCVLMNPDKGYPKAKKLLEERFGDRYIVTNAWIHKVSTGPVIRANDAEALQDLADDLENCEMTLRVTNRLGQINNEDKLVKIVERLPNFLKSRWQKQVCEIRSKGRDPTVEDVKRLVKSAAKEKNDPVFGGIMNSGTRSDREGIKENSKFQKLGSPKQHNFSIHTESSDSVKLKCYLCNKAHRLEQCTEFQKKTSADRLKFVHDRKLCENCLSLTHYAGGCKSPNGCKVEGCNVTRKHLECLHQALSANWENRGNRQQRASSSSDTNRDESPVHIETGFAESVSECTLTGAGFQTKVLPIVPVKVKARGNNKVVEVYALLDNGSTCTWCTNRLANELGASGTEVQVSLTTIERENNVSLSSKVSLEVMDLDENVMIELPGVLSREKLNVSLNGVSKQEDVDRWPHLQGIKVPEEISGEVELLIGVDVPLALEPEEIRSSLHNGPYATKTKFGWTLNGPIGRYGAVKEHCVNFVRADETLSKQFDQYMNYEFNDSLSSNDTAMSLKDREALSKFEESVNLHSGHYEIAIPWIDISPNLPNNRPLAEHRLSLLKKKLQREQDLLTKYSTFMDDLFDKGYARVVPEQQLGRNDGKVWYLPHHSVVNLQKPEKVRIVFDCAAKYRGVSLNDCVLQGPDLTNKVVGVLTRFREEPVALMSDVEAMYHQVRVHPNDVDALRFLWFPNNDISKKPREYQMLVHLFGGVWSPSCANYALLKTAEDNSQQFSADVAETVKKNFYVDDCLKSVKTENDGIKLVDELRRMLANGGFHLTKWTSNNRKVLETIPMNERAKEVRDLDFDQERLPVERALGVSWDTESDLLVFKIKPKDKPATRRGLLSIVSSVYDPLGFASPFVLSAKMIMQDLCRRKLGWDVGIPKDHQIKWNHWLCDLPKLEQFTVSRCFKPRNFEEIETSQLHHFADASEHGYGAVSYLRLTDAHSNVHCSFIMGKSRVAPVKPITVPRLELSAATLAVRLDVMCRKELSMPIDQSIFWTDSTCVLQYIENDDRRFRTFVANRLGVIHDATTPDQWRYVATELNPADDASRGLMADALLSNARWISGPEFLWCGSDTWPKRPAALKKLPDKDPEVRTKAQAHTNDADVQSEVHTDDVENCTTQLNEWYEAVESVFLRYSLWTKLKKGLAWILRFKLWLLSKVRKRNGSKTIPVANGRITVNEMKAAEQEILKFIQRQFFRQELCRLERKKASVKKSSSIKSLDPVLLDGLLRVGGRLRHARLNSDAKHPVILPKHHPVVDLIVRHYHFVSGHSGREHVLSLIREKFWIIKARVTVRKALKKCFSCRRRLQSPGQQKMADLPVDRVTPDKPPFTFVGVDCFGPFIVKRARSLVKRYGIIFTCLAIRAVHIEVAHSLDTDSFINALRRFISRRGQPEEMRSDNGGNFTCGERELREAIDEWNQQKIHEFLLQREIQWTFNPPAASHMGGVWERPIRTARKVLAALMQEQTLDDEGLVTLMCEVEAIINGRPITKVSDDPNDVEALTPNHLLLLRAGPVLPPGIYQREDMYSRRRWKQVQYMADVFWKRWKKEYLPNLQVRRKWQNQQPNMAVGDIVLLVDETAPRSSWSLGRITEVHSNTDGCVRQAVVKTKSTVLTRPIDKLCVLESAWKDGVA